MSKQSSSRILFGCMSLGGHSDDSLLDKQTLATANAAIDAAIESGIYRFDHADIYSGGRAEKVFGMALSERPELRESIELQSKCGIRFADEGGPNRYDFSAGWITHSVENTLQRLGIEQLDTLLLHRPDPLMQPEEVAEAFDGLYQAGKVARFGVSNMNQYQIERLQQALPMRLVSNQLEMGLHQLNWLDEGVNVGHEAASSSVYAAGTLEYCLANDIELQAWSPLSRGKFTGAAKKNDSASILNTADKVRQLADQIGVSSEAVVLGWLFRHPANISAVIGTTNAQRIKHCAQAIAVELSREQWYSLYVSARGADLP